MTPKRNELKAFLNKSKWFERIFPSYKRFVSLVDFIDSLLRPEQKKFLEIKYGEETIDFKTQLLIYFEDRCKFEINIWNLRQRIASLLKKYDFLFTEKVLDSNQVRVILLRELMEVISIGFQCFYIWPIMNTTITLKDLIWPEIKKTIESKYLNLPLIEWRLGKLEQTTFYKTCFWEIYYFAKGANKELWYSEFFKKTKWYLEKLNTCKQDFVNKYREKYYQIACVSLGKDINQFHLIFQLRFGELMSYDRYRILCPKIVDVEENPNIFLEEITEEIVKHFEEAELEKFKKIDSQGKEWSFKEQLFDKYYSRYPSFVSLEEIKQHIKKKVLQYRPLLTSENYETALELFMDELESELFVSKATYVWNEEMFKNLKLKEEIKSTKGVVWAIDQILQLANFENLEIEGKQYDLKTLLNARWRRAWLTRGKRGFKKRLLSVFTKSLYHPTNWNKQESSQINLQTFLIEIDSCFLYPRIGRMRKFFERRDDTFCVTKFRQFFWFLLY